MNREDREQRLRQIEGYAKTLVQEVRIMDERRHILQPLLRDEEVRRALAEKFRNTFGAHAYNHLAPMMAQDLVRDLARLLLDDDHRVVAAHGRLQHAVGIDRPARRNHAQTGRGHEHARAARRVLRGQLVRGAARRA